MKLTENKPAAVVTPPTTYTLELSGEELRILRVAIVYYFSALPVHEGDRTVAKRFYNSVSSIDLPHNPEVCFV